jgi:5-methylcytosine-specific restriction protein A
MHALKLETYEDVSPVIAKKYSPWAGDCTRLDDFVVGQEYGSYEILIFARTYSTQAGGMFLIEANGKPAYAVIKATLNGSTYPNEWIQKPARLKYYLKAIGGKFGEHFKPNNAILTMPHLPVVTFVRENSESRFTYYGVYTFDGIHHEVDGSKWFELRNMEVAAQDGEFADHLLKKAVAAAGKLTHEERLKRLASSLSKPRKRLVVRSEFVRSAEVIAEALYRAAGNCELCGKAAPFTKLSDGSPFLEVHHKTPLAEGGDDTIENAVALCPNCHRRSHHGSKPTWS